MFFFHKESKSKIFFFETGVGKGGGTRVRNFFFKENPILKKKSFLGGLRDGVGGADGEGV